MRKLLLAAAMVVALPASAQSLDLRPARPSGTTFAVMSTATPSRIWTDNIEVTQVGTYAGASWHFVWFSVMPPGCTSGPQVLGFDEAGSGGKALMSVLTTAVVSKRKVSVQSEGCNIYEVYLR